MLNSKQNFFEKRLAFILWKIETVFYYVLLKNKFAKKPSLVKPSVKLKNFMYYNENSFKFLIILWKSFKHF